LSKARTKGQSHTVQRQAQAGKLIKIRPGLYRLARLDEALARGGDFYPPMRFGLA
jgi:hypothetical protein